jgi:hypothetical protein
MKIPVKTIELVTIIKEVEVIKEVDIPDFINSDHKYFQDVINYLKTLDFITSSTCFHNFDSFISEKQGGSNTTNLDGIALLDKNMDRVTYKVLWEDSSYTKEVAYIIFRIPKSY